MIIESNFLSDRQVEDLQMMAEIINEMAVSDGFKNLDICLEKHPQNLDAYNRYASAALRAMRRVQGHGIQASIGEPVVESKTTCSTSTVSILIKGRAADN